MMGFRLGCTCTVWPLTSDVTTVNQLQISLLSPLSSVSVWQKSDRLYSELRKERSLELKFLLC